MRRERGVAAKTRVPPADQFVIIDDMMALGGIEHDDALRRVIVGLMKDDTDLFRLFSDNPDFKRWLGDTVFGITYRPPPA